MTSSAVVRSYAETLFDLGEKLGEQARFAAAAEEVGEVLASEPRITRFLESPRVDVDTKKKVLARALADRVPRTFQNFLLVALEKGRGRLLLPIVRQYQALLDEHAGRVHVQITLAREPDEQTEREIATDLSAIIGKTVIPHVEVDPAILGGIVVRYGDRLIDGSVRRRIVSLRRRLMTADVGVDAGGSDGGKAAPVPGA